jgi:hypothetical protein
MKQLTPVITRCITIGMTKTCLLQIRCTKEEKAIIQEFAGYCGMKVSKYVILKALNMFDQQMPKPIKPVITKSVIDVSSGSIETKPIINRLKDEWKPK